MKKLIFALSALCLAGTACRDKEPTDNKTQIQHVKTVLGGCNNGLPERGYIEEKDTVIISVSDDSIHVFVGLTYTCKGVPFQTKVETIGDVMHLYIEDRCYDDDNNEIDCYYERCYCYYTFDFAFNYKGEINQKYKILLYGSSSVGDEKSVRVIYEGVISRKNEGQGYPKNIPFTEYSLDGTSCQWKKLSKDSCNYSQIAVINSNEELEKYVDCTNGTYPAIDFSAHTLLLANGVRCYQDRHNYTDFQQISKQNYVMKVDFQESFAAALREWQVAIIVSKLEDGGSVVLEGGNVAMEGKEKWVWTEYGSIVTLIFYPNGENEGMFHSAVTQGSTGRVLFTDDIWESYKIEGNMMYIRKENGEFPTESDLYNKWIIHQHTDEFFEIEYGGILPDIPIVRNYLFKAQN